MMQEGQEGAPAPAVGSEEAQGVETFAQRLRRFRLATIDPTTGKPFTQEGLSLLMECRKHAVYEYENEVRTPHPLIRRELKRILPGLFPE